MESQTDRQTYNGDFIGPSLDMGPTKYFVLHKLNILGFVVLEPR